MPTMKEVCNLGLGKIGSSRVNNLAPAISTLEIKCASEYPQWKDSELRKRRWTFATTLAKLTAIATLTQDEAPDGRVQKFAKPGDLLREIRQKNTRWVRRGEFFYDFSPTINLEYIRRVPDAEMTDASFIDVLACRVANECAETAAQSPSKRRDAVVLYKDAIEEAGRLNAFTLDEHETGGDDAGYTWDMARLYPGIWG